MPDYKSMYYTLFNGVTDAIALLQQAQQRTEKIYIEDSEESSDYENEDKDTPTTDGFY